MFIIVTVMGRSDDSDEELLMLLCADEINVGGPLPSGVSPVLTPSSSDLLKVGELSREVMPAMSRYGVADGVEPVTRPTLPPGVVPYMDL